MIILFKGRYNKVISFLVFAVIQKNHKIHSPRTGKNLCAPL